MKSKWFDAAVMLALGTGLLYAGGHYYRQAYLAAFGLSAEQFQKSGDMLVLFGFHAGLMGGIQYLWWGVAALYACVAVLVLWLVIKKSARLQIRLRAWRIARIRSSRGSKRKSSGALELPAANALDRIVVTIGPTAFAAFGLLLLAIAGAEYLGKSMGERAVENFDGASRAVLNLENGASVRVGPLIVCDDASCAYLMRNGVLVLRRDRIVSVSISLR